MDNYNLIYRELIPDLHNQERWNVITLNTGLYFTESKVFKNFMKFSSTFQEELKALFKTSNYLRNLEDSVMPITTSQWLIIVLFIGELREMFWNYPKSAWIWTCTKITFGTSSQIHQCCQCRYQSRNLMSLFWSQLCAVSTESIFHILKIWPLETSQWTPGVTRFSGKLLQIVLEIHQHST